MAKLVMPGLVPGIHVLASVKQDDVDGRDKPGHDEMGIILERLSAGATSAAAAAGRVPSSWRARSAPPHNSAPPSDSRPAGPICRGIVPASCCTGCAGAASA